MAAHSAPLTPSFWLSLILAGSSLMFGAYNAYHLTDKTNEHRLTALEVKQEKDSESLHRVEFKVDKLVEWALGKQ